MARLLRSFFYKLFRDITFRITAIVGIVLAIIMTMLYCLGIKELMGCGAYMLVSSISPVQNFGIAIPVNLVIFTTLLFSQGIIRNQVIVGNSKTKVYFSLLIGGVTFTLALLAIYVGICVGLSTLITGFDPTINDITITNFLSIDTAIKLIVITITTYLVIASYSVCIASSIRNSGPCIPLAIVPMVLLGVIAMVLNLFGTIGLDIPEGVMIANRILNPFNIVASVANSSIITSDGSMPHVAINQDDFVCNLINNIVLVVTFSCVGLISFNKKDIK